MQYLMAQDSESAYFANLFLAADCLSEVRNRKSIVQISDRLLERLKLFAQEVKQFSERRSQDLDTPRDLNLKLSEKVIKAIANNWQNDPTILTWLQTCLRFDEGSYVPDSAVKAIAENYQNSPNTLPIIQQHAQSDENQYVRRTAIVQLAQGWNDDPQILQLLMESAASDPFIRKYDFETNPRQTALEGIMKYFPNHPQTEDLLLDRSNDDPDEQVREFAQRALAELE